MKNATLKQEQILRFLVDFVRTNLRQPALVDFAEEFKISREAVRGHLTLLEKKGYIEYSGQGPRNIVITDEALDLVEGENENVEKEN